MTHLTRKQLVDLIRELTQNGRRDESEMKLAEPTAFVILQAARQELQRRSGK